LGGSISRRELLGNLAGAGMGILFSRRTADAQITGLTIAGRPAELALTSISSDTIRLSLFPVENKSLIDDGVLVEAGRKAQPARFSTLASQQSVRLGNLIVKLEHEPLRLTVTDVAGRPIQKLRIDQQTGAVFFNLGDRPVLGFGEGGPQFDRRGNKDEMRNGQGGYRLRTHGGRAPIPWLIGTSGWAMFIHQPLGKFDLTRAEGRFEPQAPAELDLFIIDGHDPVRVMAEYARSDR
jgi:alpha-glucosidase/alpha-D-xyloside xylohydrolase